MKRALEEFQKEVSSCHCAPCQGNGVPVLKGTISRQLVSLWKTYLEGLVLQPEHIIKSICPPEYLKKSSRSIPRPLPEAPGTVIKFSLFSQGDKKSPWSLGAS